MAKTTDVFDLSEEAQYSSISREALSSQVKSEAAGADGRRSTRLPMAIPIAVSGIDASGETFKENTFTLSLNKHGAEIATSHELALNSEILIQNLSLGRTANAKVVRLSGRRSPRSPFEVSVELYEADNIWGVRFPPEDWQESLRVPAVRQRQEERAASSVLRSVETTFSSQAPSKEPECVVAVLAAKPASGGVPEGTKPSEVVASAGVPTPTEAAVSSGPDSPAKLLDGLRAEAQASRPYEVKNVQMQVKTVRSLEQQLGEMAARVKATRGELESLLSTAQLIRRDWRAEFKETQRQIREASEQAMQSVSEKLKETCRAEVSNLKSQISDARVEQLGDVSRALAEHASKAVASLNLAAEGAYAKLQEICIKGQPDQKRQADESWKRVAEYSTAALQGFQSYLGVVRRGFETELGEAMGELKEHGAKEALDRIQEKIDEQLDCSAQQLHRCAEDALEMLREQCGASGQALVEETREQLVAAADATLALLTRENELAAEQYRNRLQEVLQEFQGASVGSLETCLQMTLEKRREALLAELQEKMQGSSAHALDEVTSKAKQVIDEAFDTMYLQVGKVRGLMQDCANQARAQLEPYLQKSAEDFQKRVDGLSRAALAAHRRETEALVEDLQGRLQQAARGLGQQHVGE